MTTILYAPGALQVGVQNAYIKGVCASSQGRAFVQAANSAALDNPPAHFVITDCRADTAYNPPTAYSTETVNVSYTPTPQAAYLRLRWWMPGDTVYGDTSAIDVTISNVVDANVTSASSAQASLPLNWRNNPVPGPNPGTSIVNYHDRYLYSVLCEGFLDLNLVRALLPSSNDWTLSFAMSFTGAAYILRIEGLEMPRGIIDLSSSGYGMASGDLGRDQPINSDPNTGVAKLVSTMAQARLTQARYLTLAWPEEATPGTNFDIPNCAAFAFAGMTYFSETAMQGMQFLVPVRGILPPSAQGELIRWRVRYYAVPGTSFSIRMVTGSSASPFTAALADTGGTWKWSAWQAGALQSSTGLSVVAGSGNILSATAMDTISFLGQVAANTAYIDAIEVEGASL